MREREREREKGFADEQKDRQTHERESMAKSNLSLQYDMQYL